jgi:hypothetical protein
MGNSGQASGKKLPPTPKHKVSVDSPPAKNPIERKNDESIDDAMERIKQRLINSYDEKCDSRKAKMLKVSNEYFIEVISALAFTFDDNIKLQVEVDKLKIHVEQDDKTQNIMRKFVGLKEIISAEDEKVLQKGYIFEEMFVHEIYPRMVEAERKSFWKMCKNISMLYENTASNIRFLDGIVAGTNNKKP